MKLSVLLELFITSNANVSPTVSGIVSDPYI